MEALAEQVVATYLTRGGRVFLAPQYPVPGDKTDTEWSCPDFVALNFEDLGNPEVIIVEVSTGSNIEGLIKKVKDRENQWFERTRLQLISSGIIDGSWKKMRFIGFVRRDNLKKVQSLANETDVAFMAIEDATFSWDYWDTRKAGGLPR